MAPSEPDPLVDVADWAAIRKAALIELRRRQLLASFDEHSDESAQVARQLEKLRDWPEGTAPRGGRMVVIRSVEIAVDAEGPTLDPGPTEPTEHEVVLDVIANGRTSAIRTIENGPHVVVIVIHRGTAG